MTDKNLDALVVGIAQIIDHPSVYMGGPSRNSLRIAEAIVKEFGSDLCASRQVREGYRRAADIARECWNDPLCEADAEYIPNAILAEMEKLP